MAPPISPATKSARDSRRATLAAGKRRGACAGNIAAGAAVQRDASSASLVGAALGAPHQRVALRREQRARAHVRRSHRSARTTLLGDDGIEFELADEEAGYGEMTNLYTTSERLADTSVLAEARAHR